MWFKPLSTFICIFCGVWWKKSEIIKLYIAFVFFIFRKSSAYKVYALQRRRLSFYRLENSGDLATVMISRLFFSRQIEFCVHFFDLSGRLKFCNHFCDKWTFFPERPNIGFDEQFIPTSEICQAPLYNSTLYCSSINWNCCVGKINRFWTIVNMNFICVETHPLKAQLRRSARF